LSNETQHINHVKQSRPHQPWTAVAQDCLVSNLSEGMNDFFSPFLRMNEKSAFEQPYENNICHMIRTWNTHNGMKHSILSPDKVQWSFDLR
jgi:hypothetical protein